LLLDWIWFYLKRQSVYRLCRQYFLLWVLCW
jgi:hypothetical protein